MIWTNEYLNRLALEAEEDIATRIPCIIDRYSLETTKFVTEYKLPDYVQNIRRVFWKGFRLDPIGYLEDPYNYSMDGGGEITFGAFYNKAFSKAFYVGGSSSDTGNPYGGRALGYYYSKYGENVIRFDPGVHESVIAYVDGLYDTNIGNAVIIEFYRMPDGTTWKIPDYVRKRTIKAYILWKAFAKEGDGQNLKASTYWRNRYIILLRKAIAIINGVYSAIISSRDEDAGMNNCNKPARPVLPPNYGIPVGDWEYD